MLLVVENLSRVRSGVDPPVHGAGEVHTEERELRVGHGIDQRADEVVAHQRSALLAGRDLVLEAALNWIRKQ